MYLATDCKNCSSKLSFNTWEETRADYAKHKGKILVLTCKKCKTEVHYHINAFTARHKTYRALSKLVLYGLYAPMVILLFVGWVAVKFDPYYLIHALFSYYSFIAAVPLTLYFILKNSALRKEAAYNTYKVKQ